MVRDIPSTLIEDAL